MKTKRSNRSRKSSSSKVVKRMKRLGVGLRTGGFVVGRRGRIGTSELKFVDTAPVGSFVNGTPSTRGVLNGIAPGSSASQRIGRTIEMKSIAYRVHMASAAASVSTGKVPANCRMLLVYDGQTNGAIPATSDILDFAAVDSLLNLSNRDRFRVLKEHRWKIASQDLNLTAVPSSLLFTGYIKIPKAYQKVTYNAGVAGTVADIVTGGLFVIFIWDSAVSVWATASPLTFASFRVRYRDS